MLSLGRLWQDHNLDDPAPRPLPETTNIVEMLRQFLLLDPDAREGDLIDELARMGITLKQLDKPTARAGS